MTAFIQQLGALPEIAAALEHFTNLSSRPGPRIAGEFWGECDYQQQRAAVEMDRHTRDLRAGVNPATVERAIEAAEAFLSAHLANVEAHHTRLEEEYGISTASPAIGLLRERLDRITLARDHLSQTPPDAYAAMLALRTAVL